MGKFAPKGIFDSIKSLVDRTVTLFQGRVELFTTELQEEISRLVGMLLWSIVAVFTAVIGAFLLAVTTLLFIPEEWRRWIALGFAVLFLGTAAFGAFSIRRIVRAKPRPFDASLSELEKDRDRLRRRRERD